MASCVRTSVSVLQLLLLLVLYMATTATFSSVADGVGVETYHARELQHPDHPPLYTRIEQPSRGITSKAINKEGTDVIAPMSRTKFQEITLRSRRNIQAQSTTPSTYVPPSTQDPYEVYTLQNRSVLAIHALQQFVKYSRNASRTLQWQSDEIIKASRARGRMEHVFPIAFPHPVDEPSVDEADGVSKSEWIRRRDRERRRLRISTYFVPALKKYTCSALNQLVQAFMISATSAFQCRDFEVLKPTTIPKLKRLVLPIVEQWISQNLLRPETEPYVPLFVNKSLGKCTGMIPLIPLEHLNQRRVNFTGNPSSMSVEEKWRLGGITAASGLQYDIAYNRAGGQTEAAKYVKAVTPPQRAASGPMKIPSESSTTASPPASVLRGGGHPPDVIIYVTTMFEYGYLSASVCQRHPISNRPTIIHLNVDPGTLDISYNQLNQAIGSKIDNLWIEIMSFTALMQAFVAQAGLYVDSPTPLSTMGSNFTSTLNESEGVGLTRVQNAEDVFNFSYVRSASSSSIVQFKHPLVREWAKDFYNCPSPFYNDATVGVYNISNVTNTSIIPSGNGSLYTTPLGLDAYYIPSGVNQFISYYPRFHSGDSLSQEYLSSRITNVSMMLLESTGWFEVDYYRAVGIRFNPFGAGAGCSFQAKKCNQQDYLLPPRMVPSNEYPYSAIRYPGSKADTNSQAYGVIKEVHFNSTKEYDEIVITRPDLTTPLERVQHILKGTKYSNASILQSSFCFSESAGRKCHVNRKFHAACQVLAYSTPLPAEYQYYPDRTNLGGISSLDYCPTYFNSPTYCNSRVEIYGFVQDDMFCFDAVESDSYEVSIGEDPNFYNHLASTPSPRGGETGRKIPKVSVSVPVLKTSNAPKCLKVMDCDSNTTSYSIYDIQVLSGGESSSAYVLAGRCEGVGVATGIYTKGSPPIFISAVGGVTYACAPYEVVCGEITQQAPTLQPPLQALKNYTTGVYTDSISGSDGTSVIDDPMEASTFYSVNFTFVPYPALYQQRPLLSPSEIQYQSETFQENINIDSWRSFSRVMYRTPAYNGYNASAPPTSASSGVEMFPYQVQNLSFMVSAKPKLRASLRFGGLLVFTLPAGGMLHCAEQLPSLDDYNFDVQEFETARLNREARPHDAEDSSASYWSKMFSLHNRSLMSSSSSGDEEHSSEIIALLVLPYFTGNDDDILKNTTGISNNPARTVNTLVYVQSPIFQCNWKSKSPNAAFFQGDPGSFDEVALYSMLPSMSVLPPDAFKGYHADAVVSDVLNRLRYGISSGMKSGSEASKALSLSQLISKIEGSSSPGEAANYLEGLTASPFSSTRLSDRRKTLFTPYRIATKRDVNFDSDDMSLFIGELANTNGNALLQTKILEYGFSLDVELGFAMMLNQKTSFPHFPNEYLRWSSDSDVIFTSVAYLPQIVNTSGLSERRYKNLQESTATFLLEIEALHDPSTAATDSTLRITIGLTPSSTSSNSPSELLLFDSGSISLSIDSLDGALFNPASPPSMDEVNSDVRFASMYIPKREDALDPSILASFWQIVAWYHQFGDESSSPVGTASGTNHLLFHTSHPVTTTTLPTVGFNCSALVFQRDHSSSQTSRQLFANIPRIEGLVSEALFVDNFIGSGVPKMWEEWAPFGKPDDRIFYEGPLIYFKVTSDYPDKNITSSASSSPTSAPSSPFSSSTAASSHLVGCAAYHFDIDGISYQRVTPNHRQVSAVQSNNMFAPIVPPLRAVGALFGWNSETNRRRAFLGNLSGEVTRNISLGKNMNTSTTSSTTNPSQQQQYQTLRSISSSLRLFPTLGQWGDGVVAAMVYTASYGHKKCNIYLEISLPLSLTARGALYGQARNLPPSSSLMPLSVDGILASSNGLSGTSTGSDGTYSGVRVGDRINIVLDSTRFNWKDEMTHPWPNVTSTFFGCEPGVEVTVSGIWTFQRLSLVITNITRRTPLPANYSSIFNDKSVSIKEAGVSFETLTSRIPFATSTTPSPGVSNNDVEICYAAPGSVVAILMEGFFSESSLVTYSCSIEYISSVGLVNAVTGTRTPGHTAPTTIASLQFSSTTVIRQTVAPRQFSSACSNRGYINVGTSACNCNSGFAGPSCSFCSTPQNIGVSNAPCTSSCSEQSDLPWKLNCSLAQGILNPRDMCRCYCRGVVCFVPVTTPTPSTTLPPTPSADITITKSITVTNSIPPYVTPIGTPSRTKSTQGDTETQQLTHTVGGGRVLSLDMHIVLSFNTTSLASSASSSTQQQGRGFQGMSETGDSSHPDRRKRGPSQSALEGGIIIGVEAVTSKRLFSDATEITTSEKLYPHWSESVCRGVGGNGKFALMMEKFNALIKSANSQLKSITNITCSNDRSILYFHLSSITWRVNAVSGSEFAFLRLFPYGSACQSMNQTLGRLFQLGSLPTNRPQDPSSCQLAATLVATIEDGFISEIGTAPGNITFDITSGLQQEQQADPTSSTSGSIAALRGAIGLVVDIDPDSKYTPQILSRATSSGQYSLLRGVATFHRVAGFIGAILGTLTNPWLVVLDIQLSGLISLFSVRANGVCVKGELSCVEESQSNFDSNAQGIQNQLRPYGPLSLEEVEIRVQALGERPRNSYLAYDTRGVSERYSSMMLLLSPLSSGFLADWQLMFFVTPQYNFQGYSWREPGEYERFHLALSLGFMGVAVCFALAVSVVRKIDCKRSNNWIKALQAVAPFSAVMPVLLCCLFSQNVFRAAEAIAAMLHSEDDSAITVQWTTRPATYTDGVPSSSSVGVAVSIGITFVFMLCSYIGLCGLWHRAKLIIVKKVHFFPYDRLLASSVGQGWLFWSLGKNAYLARAKEGGDIVAEAQVGGRRLEEGEAERLDLDLINDDSDEYGDIRRSSPPRRGQPIHSRTYLIERRLRVKAEILNRYLSEMLQADRSDHDADSPDDEETSDDDTVQQANRRGREELLLNEGSNAEVHPRPQNQRHTTSRRIKQQTLQINSTTTQLSSSSSNRSRVVNFLRHTYSVTLLRTVTAVYIAVTPPTMLPQGYWNVAALVDSNTPASSKSRRRRPSFNPAYARAVSNVESTFCWLTRQQVAGSRRIKGSSSSASRRATGGGGRRGDEGETEAQYAKNTEDFVGATALAATHRTSAVRGGGSSVSPSRNTTSKTDRGGNGARGRELSFKTISHGGRQSKSGGRNEDDAVTVATAAAAGGGDESDTIAYPKRQYRSIAGVIQVVTQFTTPIGLCSVLLFRNAVVALLLGLSGRYQICNGPHGDERLPPSVVAHEDGAVISVALVVFLSGWFVVTKAAFVQPLQRMVLALTTIAIPAVLLCTYYADKLIENQDALLVDMSTLSSQDEGYRNLHDALLLAASIVMILYDVVVYIVLVPIIGLVVNVIEPVVLRSVEEALCLCEDNADREATEEMQELSGSPSTSTERRVQHHPHYETAARITDRRPSYTNSHYVSPVRYVPPQHQVDDAPLPLHIAALPSRRGEYERPREEEEDDMHLELDA